MKNDLVTLESPKVSDKYWWPIRQARIAEALKFPTATLAEYEREKLKFTSVFKSGRYAIRFGKPGKEAFWPPEKVNQSDMYPALFKDGKLTDFRATFKAIFDEFENIVDKNPKAAELLARMLFRGAIMADHVEVKPGKWRFLPDEEIISRLEKNIGPLISGLPLRVFLEYIDAIAWNEDVKYQVPRENRRKYPKKVGQYTFFTTCVHICLALLRKKPISNLVYSLMRTRGVADIRAEEAISALGIELI